ncbi:dual oxidase maturation factor 1-like isoform X1 [Babylonia areolata]|uniref:dual oxidase maturation factor 1-like isoform X1 n=2 Tax=Babylonia areolata TaxID=304850 RepID=UPI003FCF5913
MHSRVLTDTLRMSVSGYSAFRSNGAPTFYEALHTPVEADILVSGLIFCLAILAFSFYIVLPGIRGKERLFTFIRITVSLFIGSVILVSNFAMTWDVAETTTETKYKAGTGQDINASVAVQIGLRGINVTLKGEPEQQLNETINYNEHFSWEWRQGRFGFGPFAGRFQQEYRAAQFRGLPLPILWVAEYFTFDGEGIRWGRHYRQAGWYSHIVLWLAFPLWLLANILFFVLLRYGAYFLAMTGASMITANIIWATLRNVNDLVIPFTAEHRLEFSYGGSFWVCLITGIACILLGLIIFIMDLRFPREIALFFNVDTIQDSEEVQVENSYFKEDEPVQPEVTKSEDEDEDEPLVSSPGGAAATAATGKNGPQGTAATGDDQEGEEDEIYEIQIAMPTERRPSRVNRFTKRFQKPRRRPPPPPPPRGPDDDEDPEEDYINMQDEVYRNKDALRMEQRT